MIWGNDMKDALKKRKKILDEARQSIKKGQVILEFTFCMIIVLLMIFGVTKVFLWTGRDYAGRAIAHDTKLETSVTQGYTCQGWGGPFNLICTGGWSASGPAQQIDPYFYSPVDMNAIWRGSP